MFSRRRIVAVTGLGTVVAMRAGIAQDSSTQKETQREKNLTIGEAEAKRMLILMDKDRNGKVSKQEFMSFMEEEFERLDKNKDGEFDVKDLTQTRVRIGGAISR
jgi:Ca2+-binding EF-hand superfamily protein